MKAVIYCRLSSCLINEYERVNDVSAKFLTHVCLLMLCRESSVARPVRRCQSDLGYVSQDTVNSDLSTSLSRPRVGVGKKPASDDCTVMSHTPRAAKLRAKVTDR